jgi:UDP-3-O-acyl-N-acetylglucosamine deacetylase
MVIDRDAFIEKLAPARTFLLKHEAEFLNRQGLGRRATFADLIVFDENGPIQNRLRFENECVRHKTLDVVGDFALAPFDIVGTFTACRSGHKLNAEMVERLLTDAQILRPDDVYGTRKSA